MSEPTNPYQAPEEESARSANQTRRGGTHGVARVVEYAIAILLIIGLIWVFVAFFVTNTFSWPE